MDFGSKLLTLIKATLRGSPRPKSAGSAQAGNAKEQLQQLQKDMAQVEAHEQRIADLLRAAQAKAQQAVDSGNYAEAARQDRLAAELENRLKDQTAQTQQLAEKIDRLAEAQPAPPATPILAETPAREAAVAQTADRPADAPARPAAPTASDAPSPGGSATDPELDARKSRLSG